MNKSNNLRNRTKIDLAKEVIEDNLDVKENRRLAKLLLNKYSGVFTSLESARSAVRYAMNAYLSYDIKKSKVFAERIKKLREKLPSVKPIELPKPLKLAGINNKILVISDIHLGYQDDRAIDIALEYGYDKGINTIIINGDLFDFPRVGKWAKRPTQMQVSDEIDEGKKFLELVRGLFPDVRLVFHYGNHDIRVERYLNDRAPELYGLSAIDLKNLIESHKYKIDIVEDTSYIEAGSLVIVHGHHVVKGVFAPVNPARGAFIKSNTNILIGHLHRTSTHSEPNMKGKHTAAWSTGCLSTLRPEYNPQTSKSNLGFAYVEVEGKDFYVDNKMIIDYKIR